MDYFLFDFSGVQFHYTMSHLETYQGQYTDKMLCEMWGISEKEWSYIDSRIATIGGDDNGN